MRRKEKFCFLYSFPLLHVTWSPFPHVHGVQAGLYIRVQRFYNLVLPWWLPNLIPRHIYKIHFSSANIKKWFFKSAIWVSKNVEFGSLEWKQQCESFEISLKQDWVINYSLKSGMLWSHGATVLMTMKCFTPWTEFVKCFWSL